MSSFLTAFLNFFIIEVLYLDGGKVEGVGKKKMMNEKTFIEKYCLTCFQNPIGGGG
ncbi:MAG TPA: hypothetical protein PKC14_04155 [Candidatus Absconditabacterales bacterium]|nr:hypothetical protein [Candidatus Absconditabacterales bacterium]